MPKVGLWAVTSLIEKSLFSQELSNNSIVSNGSWERWVTESENFEMKMTYVYCLNLRFIQSKKSYRHSIYDQLMKTIVSKLDKSSIDEILVMNLRRIT